MRSLHSIWPHSFKENRRVFVGLVGVGLWRAVEYPGNLMTADLGVGLKVERLVGFGGNANSVTIMLEGFVGD